MAHQYLEYMPKSTFHPKTLIPDMFAMWKPVSDMQQFAWEAEHGGSVRNPRRRRARRNPLDAYPGLLSHAEVVSHFAARKGIPETYIPLGIHQRWRTGTYCHAFLVKEKGHVLVLSTGLPVRLFLPDFKRYFEVLPELEQLALAAVERPRARRNPKDWWPASLDTNAGADAQARAWARKLKVDVSRLGYATSSMGPKAHFLHVYAVGDGYTVLAVESAPDSKGGRHWILTHWTKDTLLSRYLKVPELQALAFASHA
jgi:hypothetical protein